MFFNSCCNRGNSQNFPYPNYQSAINMGNGMSGNFGYIGYNQNGCGCNRLNTAYIPGPQGPVGPQGPMGPIGPQGAVGPQGPQGVPGATGPQGATGATGPQGPAGANGVDGAAAGFGTPTATATTLASGSAATATVTATGPDTAKIFSFEFGIPQGAVGPTGPAGADGAAAGFGEPTATIDELAVGAEPTVTVTASGPATAQVFDFAFGIPAPVTTDSMYAANGTQTVGATSIIPLVETASPTGTGVTFATNEITVPAGTYLVSYGASGVNATGNSLSVQLYAEGVGVDGATITDEAGADTFGNVSKTVLYTAAVSTPLSIYNATAQAVTLSDAYLTVVRIA